jgi:hypothetical protein
MRGASSSPSSAKRLVVSHDSAIIEVFTFLLLPEMLPQMREKNKK